MDNLACERHTDIPNPVTVTTDADGQVISATVNLPVTSTTAASTAAAPTTTAASTSTAAPTTEQPTTTSVSGTTASSTAATASSTTAAIAVTPSSGPTAPNAPTPSRPAAVLATNRQPLAATATRHTAATATGDAATATALGSAELPFTGSDSRTLLAVAGALVLGGSGLLWRASLLGKRHPSS